MIVTKFGGAVLGNAAGVKSACATICTLPSPQLVVVSAFANVTNWLEQIAHRATEDPTEAFRLLQELLKHHEHIAAQLLPEPAYADWLNHAIPWAARLDEIVQGLSIVRELSPRTLDMIVHYGERYSSSIVAAALQQATTIPVVPISALELIITDDAHRYARPNIELTRERVQALLHEYRGKEVILLTEGYIARGASGQVTTMGRESSSYTATLLGQLLQADEVRIYTDVPGVMTADPAIIPAAETIPTMSYEMANALAELGAKVLHPRTVAPVERASIPLVITSLQGGGKSTVIASQPNNVARGSRSIALLPEATVVMIETEVANAQFDQFCQTLAAQVPLLWRHHFRRKHTVVTALPIEPGIRLPSEYVQGYIRADIHDAAVVSLVSQHPIPIRELQMFFGVLKSQPILALQGGGDARTLSVAIAREHAHQIVEQLHQLIAAPTVPQVSDSVLVW
ncbi:MAG: aspartate kinase [Armatimonadetes bacterium]|nr:aspartate kinase [Armatimonadota bacterium]